MSNKTVQFVVHFSIQEGKFLEFEDIAQKMTALTQKEPGALDYSWFLNEDRKSGRLVELYVDSNAVTAHLNGPVIKEVAPALLKYVSFDSFDINGDLGSEAASILHDFRPTIFKYWHGIGRQEDA